MQKNCIHPTGHRAMCLRRVQTAGQKKQHIPKTVFCFQSSLILLNAKKLYSSHRSQGNVLEKSANSWTKEAAYTKNCFLFSKFTNFIKCKKLYSSHRSQGNVLEKSANT